MSEKNKYGYLAKNTAIFTISSFGSKILTFLLVPLYTHILTTAEYGVADLITTSVMLLGYIFTLNIGDSVLRFAIDEKDNSQQIIAYGVRLLIGGTGILGILLLCFYKFQVIRWPLYYFVYMLLYYLGFQMMQMLNNYLRAIDKVRNVAISGIITTVLTIISNVVFLLIFDFKLSGYLLSMVIGVFGTCIYQMASIKISIMNYIILPCTQYAKKEMLIYCIPLIFNGIAWWMNSSLDKYFITYMLGSSANGIYAVAYKIPTILTMIQSIFNQAWNLSAIKEFDKNDSDGFFSKTYITYNAGLIIVCSFLILINIPVSRILFAKEFFEAWKFAPLLLLSTLFGAMSGFVGSIFSAIKNSKVYAVSTVTAATINIVLNAVLIPVWGIVGAAVATLISFIAIWIIRLVISRKYIKWKIHIIKDVVAYLLLLLQVVVASSGNHYYGVQVIVISVLFCLYLKNIKDVVTSFVSIIFKKKRG